MSETIEIVGAPHELRRTVRAWKAAGLRVGLVPTMGALHEGHSSLVRLACEQADRVIASIFVNPTQFGPDEDFERYPRHGEKDAALLAANGCDLIFAPEAVTIYPAGHSVFVDLDESALAPSRGMESNARPGHFRGVATVVTKLFNLVEPHLAVFGEKDAQQLAVVRRLVRDLHIDVEILAHPTVREADGLAMSSRNAYLSPQERTAAPGIHRTLTNARQSILDGERRAEAIRRGMRASLSREPLFSIDYAEVVDADTFQPLDDIDRSVILPVAVRVGGTRLLDNLAVDVKAGPAARAEHDQQIHDPTG